MTDLFDPARVERIKARGPLIGSPGTCSDCKRKRIVYSITRSGGGSYRRGSRTYSTSICGECAEGLKPYLNRSGSTYRWDTLRLEEIIIRRDRDQDAERPRHWR